MGQVFPLTLSHCVTANLENILTNYWQYQMIS